MEVYFFDPVKHPPARMRWEERREACQDRHDHYEEIRQMTNKIVDQSGVVQNGPESLALARAQAQPGEVVIPKDQATAFLAYTDDCRRRGEHPLNFEDWAEGQMPEPERRIVQARRHDARGGNLLGASVGSVDRQQGGILPTGPTRISDEMVERAFAATQRVVPDHPLGRSEVRAILEAALRA